MKPSSLSSNSTLNVSAAFQAAAGPGKSAERLFRPHDLLRLKPLAAIELGSAGPLWVEEALQIADWVVVRRQRNNHYTLPVGVRGNRRSQRWAGEVSRDEISEQVTPEDLVRRREAWSAIEQKRRIPAFRALKSVANSLDESGFCWGPIGAVGFELTTHCRVTTLDSDLDLLVQMPSAQSRQTCRELLWLLREASPETPIDVQVETPHGAFALSEYAIGSSRRTVLRRADGPHLVINPWHPAKIRQKRRRCFETDES